jgi:mRNA interferase MazF
MAPAYQLGSIVNVDLGEPPYEVQGHEQGYERPCVIIKLFSELKLAIILPCSSKEPTYNHYTVVKMLNGTGGLSKDSYVLCHQIRTISFDRVIRYIGTLDVKNMLKVRAVLLDTLDL